ncbi:hypothetical protein SHEWT2_02449 [Shewanella hafniensis]|uniref:Uncharacterized protein n=1 Tax=Shewanella putrefaciens (strain 200) TaxID=399804 RepID=E6XPE9_SHEP2|nr:hypothetical protein SHEWT2_02449 [Shewanella hafniensis]
MFISSDLPLCSYASLFKSIKLTSKISLIDFIEANTHRYNAPNICLHN